MTHVERHSAVALTRPLAVLGALALLLSLVPFVGTAAAQENDPPPPQDLSSACEHVDTSPEGEHGFPDISGYSPQAREAIRCANAYDIARGYETGNFEPGAEIRRYQMALFLVRIAEYVEDNSDFELPAPEDQGFTDIGTRPQDQQDAINLLGTIDVTHGTSETTFSPYADVPRRDMASFIVRLQDEIADQLDDEDARYQTEAGYFPDVPDTMERSGDVNAIASAGITQGRVGGTYAPFDSVPRVEMALFVMRHLDENVEAGRIPALGEPEATGSVEVFVGDVSDAQPTEPGDPVGGADVTLIDGDGFEAQATTEDDGEVTFSDVPVSGDYTVSADADGYVSDSEGGVGVVEDDTTDVALRLYAEGPEAPDTEDVTQTTSGADDVTVSGNGEYWVIETLIDDGAGGDIVVDAGDADDILYEKPDGEVLSLGAAGTGSTGSWWNRDADTGGSSYAAGAYRLFYVFEDDAGDVPAGTYYIEVTFEGESGALDSVNGEAYADPQPVE